MKRLIDFSLQAWQKKLKRKPLLLRGARQIGKTFAVRKLAKNFASFVEINFENDTALASIFEVDLDAKRIIRDLQLHTGKRIIPGTTLLFFDEIQAFPRALISLRYLYEEIPELHVIAAGSLLEFAIQKVGMPVGRIESLYMYPLSFIEFLVAKDELLFAREILNHDPHQPIHITIHNKGLKLIGEYLAIGGLPEVVSSWVETADYTLCQEIQGQLIDTYRDDFGKYARLHQLKYLELLYSHIPSLLGKKFKYSSFPGGYQKRELAPCLDLLCTAGLVHKVFYTSGGVPPMALADLDKFKIISIDIALTQTQSGITMSDWFLHPKQAIANKGEVVEAFVGQELLVYGRSSNKEISYFWHREARGSQAEVDYLMQQNSEMIPIEVKSGERGSLQSMKLYFESHPTCSYGIRFSTHNYSVLDKIYSYPLYAVASILPSQKEAMLHISS